MSLLRYYFWGVFVLLGFSSVQAALVSQTPLSVTTSDLSGRLVQGTENATNLTDVEITITPVVENAEVVDTFAMRTTTDETGQFEFEQLPADDYQLMLALANTVTDVHALIGDMTLDFAPEADEVETVDVILSGHVFSSHDDTPIAEVEVSIPVLELSTTTDDNGYFEFNPVFNSSAYGDYQLSASKAGYVFADNMTVTIDQPENDVTLRPSIMPTSAEKSIFIAKHTCDNNTISINTPKGEKIHSISSSFTSRGVYLRDVLFDDDDLTDIAVGELGEGRDVTIINLKAEPIGFIETNADKKGGWVDFGDVTGDGEFNITVTSQAETNQIDLHKKNGKAIRPLIIFDQEVKINVAIGDVTGDGVANIVVGLAERKAGDNVFVFDENGQALYSFAAILETTQVEAFERAERKTDKASAITLALGDIDGDGKQEIIAGQSGKNVGFGVAIYDEQGQIQWGMNAFGGKINKGESKGCDSYKAYGVVLASDDLDKDGKAEIIVAKAGGQDVRVFNGKGQLMYEFSPASSDEAITSLAIGDKVEIETPEVTADNVPAEKELQDIIVRGEPDKRVELKDKHIKGTVKISHTTLINVTVDASANLEVGPGTLFDKAENIPPRLPLTKVFNTVNIRNTVNVNINITPLDLNTSVVENAPTVLEDIKVVVKDEVKQRPDNGNLVLKKDKVNIEVCPIRVDQADEDDKEGLTFEEGTWVIVTDKRQKVTTVPVSQNFPALVDGLKDIKVEGITMDENGLLRGKGEKYRYLGIASLFAIKLDIRVKNGVNFVLPSKYNSDKPLSTLNYDDEDGQQWQQDIRPTLADITVLRTDDAVEDEETEMLDDLGNVVTDAPSYNIVLEDEGIVGFTFEGKRYRAFPDYKVTEGTQPESGDVEISATDDINKDGTDDFVFNYANGERQLMFIIKEEEEATDVVDVTETDTDAPDTEEEAENTNN